MSNHSNQSSVSVWTEEQCESILKKERIELKKSRAEFWQKITAWHNRQYETNNVTDTLPWADECLEVLTRVEVRLGLDNEPTNSDVSLAKTLFSGIKEAVAKRSVFEGLR